MSMPRRSRRRSRRRGGPAPVRRWGCTWRLSFLESLRADYPAACRAAEEGARVALELSDVHSFLLSQYYLAWGLLHSGRWGEMSRILGKGLEMAERNESRRWTVLYQLELAWLH